MVAECLECSEIRRHRMVVEEPTLLVEGRQSLDLRPSSSSTSAFARRASRCATAPSRARSIRSRRDSLSRKPGRIMGEESRTPGDSQARISVDPGIPCFGDLISLPDHDPGAVLGSDPCVVISHWCRLFHSKRKFGSKPKLRLAAICCLVARRRANSRRHQTGSSAAVRPEETGTPAPPRRRRVWPVPCPA